MEDQNCDGRIALRTMERVGEERGRWAEHTRNWRLLIENEWEKSEETEEEYKDDDNENEMTGTPRGEQQQYAIWP